MKAKPIAVLIVIFIILIIVKCSQKEPLTYDEHMKECSKSYVSEGECKVIWDSLPRRSSK